MITAVNARKLMEITEAGRRLITDDEFMLIIKIYFNAANRAEKECKSELEGQEFD